MREGGTLDVTKCPYCQFSTKFSASLERHINRYHEADIARRGRDENKYTRQPQLVTCTECGVRWGNQSWLEWHLKHAHNAKEVEYA